MSRVVKQLMGGLGNGKSNGSVLEAARKRLVAANAGKKVSLDFLEKKPGEAVDDGRINVAEAAKHVQEKASKAYDWIVKDCRPFLRDLDGLVAEIGQEVLDDVCEDGSQSNRSRRQDYETAIDVLLTYSPEQDDFVRAELELIPARRTMWEKLFQRITDATRLGMMVDDLRHAEDKDFLEHLLDGKIFVHRNDDKGKVPSFKKNESYDVAEGSFGHFHDFAVEKMTEAVKTRKRELVSVHKAMTGEQKKSFFTKLDTDVQPEEFFFGEVDEATEKTVQLPWKFRGYDNGVRLRRVGDRIYVTEVLGDQLVKDLEAAKDATGEDLPYLLLGYLLANDGEHLCLGEDNGRGKAKYKFGAYVKPDQLLRLACWVRTGAGENLQSRLLQGDFNLKVAVAEEATPAKRARFIKPAGENLTDQEFLYYRGLGQYNLVYVKGFKYEPRDENEKPTGNVHEITADATAVVIRKEVDGKDKVEIVSVSAKELEKLLEAGGAEAGHDYFEGIKGVSLPVPLRLGIGQAFGRLRKSE